jgi:hypothetical protein
MERWVKAGGEKDSEAEAGRGFIPYYTTGRAEQSKQGRESVPSLVACFYEDKDGQTELPLPLRG